jgi:uncharacterized protein
MILVDSNVLIFAYNEASVEHKAARKWLAEILAGPTPICFSWIALMAFVRVSTNKKIFTKPYSTNEAYDVVEDWLSAPRSQIVEPADEHLRIAKRLAQENGVYGAGLTDVHLAALAIEHGLSLATTDSDFRAFKGLKLINPLTA